MNRDGVRNRQSWQRTIGRIGTAAVRVAAPEALERRALLSGWTTVDDFQVAPGHSSGTLGIASDSAGNIYAVGAGLDSKGAPYGFVREKHVGDEQWTTTAILPGVRLYKAAIDASGDLYVQAESSSAWVVMERQAGRFNFEEVDRFAGTLDDLATDEAGDIYAVGHNLGQTAEEQHWIVRKRTGGQGSFVTVDDFVQPGAIGTFAHGVQVVSHGPSAGVYVVGTFGDPPYPNPDAGGSLVRKSVDGGATWSLVDDFDFDPQGYGGGSPVAVTADAAGNLFYLGGGLKEADGPRYEFVRRSGDGGATWSIIDTFLADTFALSDIGADAAGNLYVVGSENLNPYGGPASFRSIVRSNASGSWEMVDEFQLAPDKATYGYGVAFGHAGNVYVCGFANDASAVQHGIIRAFAATTPPPVVFISSSSWSSEFVSALSTAGLGDAGYVISSGGAAAQVLPWTNLNQIQVKIGGDAPVREWDLSLNSADGHAYVLSSFTYDDASRIGTWTLGEPLGADRVTVHFINQQWRFNALPGDVDRSGSVNASYLVKVRNRVGATPGPVGGNYGVFFDVNGDGRINASDLVRVRNGVGTALPPLSALRPLFGVERIIARDDDGDRISSY